MADIKLIATDLDGTFLESPSTAHPDNVKALLQCREMGIPTCICTGRNLPSVKAFMKEIPFGSFGVINNGAAIYDIQTDSLRYRNRFDPEIVFAILSLCASYEGANVDAVTTEYRHVLAARITPAQRAWMQTRAKEHSDALRMHESLQQMADACVDDMQRVGLGLDILSGDGDALTDIYERLSAITGVEVTASRPGYMEITPREGTKAAALSVLADIYNVKPENVLAFGDNYNDIHMLLWAGTGVAMGNAEDRVKSIADYVTDTNVNGGVARAIERIVFKRA